jgi:hypothetical protein
MKTRNTDSPAYVSLTKCMLFPMFSYSLLLEVLSFFNSLNEATVMISGFISMLLGVIIVKKEFKFEKAAAKSIKRIHLNVTDKITGLVIAIYLTVELIVSLKAPPNNWDSMAYHLPRIKHWLNNSNLEFFETMNLRQLWNPPGSEKFMMFFESANLPVSFLNLVQYLSQAGCLVLLLAFFSNIRVSKCLSYLLVIVFITAPNVITQSQTTQNDLFAAFMVLINFLLLYFLNQQTPSNSIVALYGMSLSLCLEAKGTTLIYSALSLLLFIALIMKQSLNRIAKHITSVIAFVFALNGPHWLRNINEFNSPLGPTAFKEVNDNPTISGNLPYEYVVNFFHFIIYNFQTYSKRFNEELFIQSEIVMNWLGINLQSPGSSFLIPTDDGGLQPLFWPTFEINEDSAVSTIYIIVLLVTVYALVSKVKNFKVNRIQLGLFLIPIGFFLGLLIVRWNPWLDRYFIAPFVIALVVIGSLYQKLNLKKTTSATLIVVLSLYGFPFLFLNSSRPILGGNSIFSSTVTENQFRTRADLGKDMEKLKVRIEQNKPSQIIFETGLDVWEYPIWQLAEAVNIPIKAVYPGSYENVSDRVLMICYSKCYSQSPVNKFILLKEKE